MNTASFSIKEALGFGWAMTKEKFWFLLSLILISAFFGVIPDIVDTFVDNEQMQWLLLPVQVVSFVLGFVIDAGLIYIMLRLYDGKEVKVSDVFSQYPITFQYFVVSAAYALMVIVGSILLIVPGVYLALRYQFSTYFLVDKRTDIVESFKRSAAITDGQKWHLLRFALAMLGVNILGLLALGVGLFVSVPVSMLAFVYVYRKLSSPIDESAMSEEDDAKTFLKTLEGDVVAPDKAQLPIS